MHISLKHLRFLCLLLFFDGCLILFRNLFVGTSWEPLASLDNIITYRSHTFLFLIWNLFLSVIPFALALGIYHYRNQKYAKWLLWPSILLWLAFLPNAPYLITDLIHIRPRAFMPLWYDTFTFFAFAWSGLLFGIGSLQLIGAILEEKWGSKWSLFAILSVILLCSFGIAAGRFLRWNSWDLLAQPFMILDDISSLLVNPLTYKNIWGMAMLFSAFLSIVFLSSKNQILCEQQ